MIVNAQIFIGNMSDAKQSSLMALTSEELKSLTGFDVQEATRDDCLANWSISVNPEAPDFAGEAFVREDFVEAILDIVDDVK